MTKYLATKLALSILIACLFSCAKLQVFKDPDKPFFFSNEKKLETTGLTDSLNVLTFNIKKALKIELAIAELHQLQEIKKIDIFLLQEMDEKGVKLIAGALGLNYLYIPITYDKVNKNIGNAILTKGTIAHPEKLILPHAKWQNNQRRHVTIGEVFIHQKKILVYSVHTETVMMRREKRMDQINVIVAHATMQAANRQYVLIGGDFNTLLPKDSRLTVEKFNSSGFNWATAKTGSTARAMLGLVRPRHDYIFTLGLQMTSTSTIKATRSSDHYPVFASFRY